MAEQEERTLTVPLRVVRTVPRTQRAPRAVKAIREHVVRGTLGPGGPPLKIYTGDGSIRLTGL